MNASEKAVIRHRESYALDEGDVVITFPEILSAQSFRDLRDHIDLFMKKMERRVVNGPPSSHASLERKENE